MSNQRLMLIALFVIGLLLGVTGGSLWMSRVMDHRVRLEVSRLGGTYSTSSAVKLRDTGVAASWLRTFLSNPVAELDLSLTARPRKKSVYPLVTDKELVILNSARNLQTLTLRGMPVTDAAVEPLSKCLRLRNLDVRETKITAKGIAELKSALPDCQVLSSEEK